MVKVLEGIIREKLVTHLEENDIITNKQHGFRKNRSCLTNLLEYLDDLVNAVDEKDWVDINYLDCEKAFDRVPQGRLSAKLGSVGISGRVLGWIENFLRDRRQSKNSRQRIFMATSIQWRTTGLSSWSCSLHSVHKRHCSEPGIWHKPVC